MQYTLTDLCSQFLHCKDSHTNSAQRTEFPYTTHQHLRLKISDNCWQENSAGSEMCRNHFSSYTVC